MRNGTVSSTVNQTPESRASGLVSQPTTRHVDAGGLAMHVREWSSPNVLPSIVLVHGLASNARLWDGAADSLARLGYHVVSIDQRGHGQSAKPDDGYDMATVVGDLAALITAMRLDRPVVAGQSWGGNVVVELAYRRPDLVRGVCAVDGGLIQLNDKFATWESCAEVLAPPMLVGTPRSRFESMIRNAYRGWPETAIEGTLANMETLDDGSIRPWLSRERHMRVLRGLWDHRPHDIVGAITRPLLFTPADSGDAHSITKRDDYERVTQRHEHVRVEWFSPAHHDLHAQYPERWASVVDAHVTGGFLA